MIAPTEEQNYKARAANFLRQANGLAEGLKQAIEDGIVLVNGERADSGMKGWQGFEKEQKEALQRFIHDFSGSIIIQKP